MRLALLGMLLALGACEAAAPPATRAELAVRAAEARPGDARLAQLYETSCKSCHAVADTGAPLARNRADWDPRWRQGEDILFQHTISGFNGMPAGGQCFTCSADDYRALIAFMAGRGE